ncbi:hypothetical protein VQ056_33285 [Paenibacillus sp. JTLBN-2024]
MPTVDNNVTTMLLKMNRVTGRNVSCVAWSRSVKFCSVGWRTKNVGGNRNSSCSG